MRRASFDHLREIRERLRDYPIAVEFRHESWFGERHRASTLAFEREMQFCNVIVDEPQDVPGSIRPSGKRRSRSWRCSGCTGATRRPGT
ncbi:MAG TPA: DUF72 domain-containing protein [Steroidobacteraceae bacterium]|nr:DUF72 domain-containing protein [Steroidobacteraceae bacterium]